MAHNFMSIYETRTLAAAADKTLIQLHAAANIPLVIEDVWISLDGQSNTEKGVRFWIVKQDDNGAATDISANAVMTDARISHTLQATLRGTYTAEPTVTAKKNWQFRFHPQSGVWRPATMGRKIIVPAGTRMGIMYNADDAHVCDVTVEFEE